MTSWPFTFPQQHLTDGETRLLYQVVRYIRNQHGSLYRKFLYDQTIADDIVEYLTEAKSPTLASVVRDLRARAKKQSAWLVEVQLANLLPPVEACPLGPRAMLVRGDSSRERVRWGPHLTDVFVVKRHLGDELTPRGRWLHSPAGRERGGNDAGRDPVDTRVFASLLFAEDGTEEVAMSLAQTRARIAVAFWCLLSPPRRTKHRRPVWPTVTNWAPVPHIRFGVIRKEYEPSFRMGRKSRRGAMITEFGPYELTKSEAYLLAPFRAMDAAHRGNDAALNLLSAARSLYLAARIPNDLESTERLVHVWRAKEALCQAGLRGCGKANARWEALVRNLQLRDKLVSRGYALDEIDEAFELAQSLRDLTTHFPDDVLVNLNYPEKRKVVLTRGRTLSAESIGLAYVADDWPVLSAAVHLAARRLAKAAIRDGWDERKFHRRFT
ncbi:MAG: hypothetical protein H0V68_02590 [Actinobacteria bacterium]|nr:hypothetical protein [Actinomycetota bacterium]